MPTLKVFIQMAIILPALFLTGCNDSQPSPKNQAALDQKPPVEEPDVVQNSLPSEPQDTAVSEKPVTTTWVASWSSKE